MDNNMTALVLGATGGIGGEVARQLRDAGWTPQTQPTKPAPPDTRWAPHHEPKPAAILE